VSKYSLKHFERYRVDSGSKVKLPKRPTTDAKNIPAREEADAATDKAAEHIGQLQDVLYAEGKHALLVVLQGMDAAGKDGTVRRVFDNVNPTGVNVTSFKQPTWLELRHDFLWRCHEKVPARGTLGVFNRSYYEDVLIVRVHADRLLPDNLIGDKKLWDRRFTLINSFERLLADNGTTVLKFFLHISKQEQAQRFRDRQKDPDKHWKLAAADFTERGFWNDYQAAYEEMLPETSTDHAPWYIIPGDKKWARNYIISHIIAATLERMNPKFPELQDKSLITKRFK